MGLVEYLLVSAVLMVLSMLLMPSPNVEDAKKGNLDEFGFPTNMENRNIPLAFGTNRLTGPNIIWYGNLRTRPIKEDLGGPFSTDWVILGWKYYVGFDLALCAGPVDSISQIRINDKIVLEAGQNGVPVTGLTDGGGADGEDYFIDLPELEGGHKKGGGVQGNLKFYNGNYDTNINQYLIDKSGSNSTLVPGYPGLSRIVWEGGYVGERATIGDWDVVIHNYPNPLALTGGKERINTVSPSGHGDANPLNILYTILNNEDYGLGISEDLLDISSFQAAADVCFDEGLGFSYLIQSGQKASAAVKEILEHINGFLFQDFNGKFTITLTRDDYTPASLPLFDPTNITKIKSVTKSAWSKTQNSAMCEYVDWVDNFKATNAVAHDLGNIEMQRGQHNLVKKKFPGCRNATTAAFLAQRTLSEHAIPLVAVTLETNRDGALLNPGDVVRVTDPDFGLSEKVIRVAEISRGNATTPSTVIKGMEDIFSTPQNIVFTGGSSSLHENVSAIAEPAALIEMSGLTAWEYTIHGGNSDESVRVRHDLVPANANNGAFELMLQNPQSGEYIKDSGTISMTSSLLSEEPSNGTWRLTEVSDHYVADGSSDTWTGSTAYALGDRAQNGTENWEVTSAGTSAASGGPTGGFVASPFTDGSVTWTYLGNAGLDVPVIQFGDFDVTAAFRTQSLADIQAYGYGLIRVGDEFMAYTTVDSVSTSDPAWQVDPNQTDGEQDLNGVSLSTGSRVTGISGIYRGLLDTDIVDHSPGERVWFYAVSDLPINQSNLGFEQQTFKHITSSPTGKISLDAAAPKNISEGSIRRFEKPLRPSNITMNGNTGAASRNINIGTGSMTTGWTNQGTQPNESKLLIQTDQSISGSYADLQVQWRIETSPGSGSFQTIRTDTIGSTTTTQNTILTRPELEAYKAWSDVGAPNTYEAQVRIWRTDLTNDSTSRDSHVTCERTFFVQGD